MELIDLSGKPIPTNFRAIIELVNGRLSSMQNVLSVMVTGSVALGWADDFSDVSIKAICDTMPSPDIRRSAYVGFGPPIIINSKDNPSDPDGWDEFDIHHATGRTIVNIILETYNNLSMSIERILSMKNAIKSDWDKASEIQDSLIVFDRANAFKYLRDKIHPMPESIRKFLVEQCVWKINEYAERAKKTSFRKDVFSARIQLWNLVKILIHICLRFNGIYYSGENYLQNQLSRCSLLPERFAERLIDVMLKLDLVYAFHQWLSMAQETVHFVSGSISEGVKDVIFKEFESIGDWSFRHW